MYEKLYGDYKHIIFIYASIEIHKVIYTANEIKLEERVETKYLSYQPTSTLECQTRTGIEPQTRTTNPKLEHKKQISISQNSNLVETLISGFVKINK